MRSRPARGRARHRPRRDSSILYGATSLSYAVAAEFDVLAARLYRLKTERLYGLDKRADVFWIEDVQSGETVHCAWPRRI